MTVKKRSGWLAKIPNIKRKVVPEFPALSTSIGSLRLPSPIPLTVTNSELSSDISAPIAEKQAAVLRGSSPNNKPRILVSPSANEPSIKARWEIDLSPGIVILPRKPWGSWLASIVRR